MLTAAFVLLLLAAARAAAQVPDVDPGAPSSGDRLDDSAYGGDRLDDSTDGGDRLDDSAYGDDRERAFVHPFESGWLQASSEVCECSRDDMQRAIGSAPPLGVVVSAAYHAAGLANDPVGGWSRRSRWSALVPAITARVGNSESWREVTDPTVSHAAAYDVRVSWRLDRLIYDPNEPRFASFDLARRRERRHLAALVTRAYFAWVQARAAFAGAAPDPSGTSRGPGSPGRWLIQAQHAHADLDALTDGWFSHILAKPSGSR